MPQHPWPATRRDAIVDTLHGKQVADPYRWLEDEHSDEVKQWMSAQDAYTRGVLAALPKRAELAARMKTLAYYDSIGAPIHRRGHYFYARKHANQEKTVVYWKAGESGAEQVLFDPNQWSADGTRGLGGWWPSDDGTLVAYSIKENNSDETTTHVREVASGLDRPDVIAGTKYSGASWAPDSRSFYYVWLPPPDAVPTADRPGHAELRHHVLGTDPATDTVIHPATGNPETFLGGGISRDGHWLTAQIQHGWSASDLYFKDARDPHAAWRPLVVGVDANFTLDIWRDHFYVMSNDGAPRYRLYRVDPSRPARADWTEIVPESDATLESFGIVGEHLVLTYLRRAASEVEVRTLAGALVRKLELPPLGTSGGISGNEDEDTGYFAYTSFTEPQVIYKTSIQSGAVSEWTRITLPIDTSRMVTEQVEYASKDGTLVSMFLIRRDDQKRDGTAPTILYGYGGFNVNMTPAFAGSRALWIEGGGVYAIPNLRGGGEYGEDWHKGGMLLQKQNVFDDFIGAAEYLIREGWTTPEHLAISGGSNGGLLVGAAATQRPELFKAVICAVPLLDMIRYHLSGSGRTWVPEYGSAEDAAQFEALHAYSPYRVAVDAGPRAYPSMLFDSADHDDRVDPAHARKLAAVIQSAQTAEGVPILLRIEKNAGHGGADMVKAQVDRAADTLAFLWQQLHG